MSLHAFVFLCLSKGTRGLSLCTLRFEMTGGAKRAKRPLERPIDGGVTFRAMHVAWALLSSAARPFVFASLAQ